MSKLVELIAQRDAIENQIAELRKSERAEAIRTIRDLVERYGLTTGDFLGSTAKKSTSAKLAPKFRDPESGKTWTGRGKAPRWIAGKDRAKFAVSA